MFVLGDGRRRCQSTEITSPLWIGSVQAGMVRRGRLFCRLLGIGIPMQEVIVDSFQNQWVVAILVVVEMKFNLNET